jgi:hypothetical protein
VLSNSDYLGTWQEDKPQGLRTKKNKLRLKMLNPDKNSSQINIKKSITFFILMILIVSSLAINVPAQATTSPSYVVPSWLSTEELPFKSTQLATDNLGNIYAGLSNGTVLKSSDGNTWSNLHTFETSIRGLFVDSRGYVFVGADGWFPVYRSTNGGVTWTQVLNSTVNWVHSCMWNMAEDTTGNLYMVSYIDSANVWKSTNAGTTWTLKFNATAVYGVGVKHCHLVMVDKSTNYVYVTFGDTTRGLLRSMDGGDSWQLLDTMDGYTSGLVYNGYRYFGADSGATQVYKTKDDVNFEVAIKYPDRNYAGNNVFFFTFSLIQQDDVIYAGTDTPGTLWASAYGKYQVMLLNFTHNDSSDISKLSYYNGYIYVAAGNYTIRFKNYDAAQLTALIYQGKLTADSPSSDSVIIRNSIPSYIGIKNAVLNNVNIYLSGVTVTNLAINPSFESWTNNVPTGYSSTFMSATSSTDKINGQTAIQATANAINQALTTNNYITVKNNTYYTYSIYVKPLNNCRVSLSMIVWRNSTTDYPIIDSFSLKSNMWQHVSWTYQTPSDVIGIKQAFKVKDLFGGSNATVLFDAISLQETKAPNYFSAFNVDFDDKTYVDNVPADSWANRQTMLSPFLNSTIQQISTNINGRIYSGNSTLTTVNYSGALNGNERLLVYSGTMQDNLLNFSLSIGGSMMVSADVEENILTSTATPTSKPTATPASSPNATPTSTPPSIQSTPNTSDNGTLSNNPSPVSSQTNTPPSEIPNPTKAVSKLLGTELFYLAIVLVFLLAAGTMIVLRSRKKSGLV